MVKKKMKPNRPTDKQVEKDVTHWIIVQDVVDTIHEIDPIGNWEFLGNYLAFRGVFK